MLDKALRGPLLRDRTCVLVTHHVDLVLPAASYHVQLDRGRIASQGPVERAAVAGVDSDSEGPTSPVPGDLKAAHPSRDKPRPIPLTGSKVEGWSSGDVKVDMYRRYGARG